MIKLANNSMSYLETWKSQEYMQIQESRQLFERASALISKKAEEFVNKSIENTLRDYKLGNIQSVDGNLGRRGERQADYGNLVAAEAALMELVVHIKEKARSGK